MSILTVVTREESASTLARLGISLATAMETSLVLLQVDSGQDGSMTVWGPGEALPADSERCLSALRQTLEDLGAAAGDLPPVEIRSLTASDPLRAVLRQVEETSPSLLLAAKRATDKGDSLARKLFQAAPGRTLLVRPGESTPEHYRRILVPTAGGRHAAAALDLGGRLARGIQGELVALYVQPPISELAQEVGARVLDRALAAAAVELGSIDKRVVLADRPEEAIAAAAEGCDLVLLGASEVGRLRQQLFGTVPDRLLSSDRGMTVGVVRERWRLLHRLRSGLGRWLDLTIPQLSRAERVSLYERLQSGSAWNFDFMTLMGLATAIAGLGLLQNSAAVVIGAMLVAPLMTPILGAGLALVQGNWPLLKVSVRSVLRGYLTALGIGLALGWMVPIPALTDELLARGGPTLLDMGVAFLSGLAAAHCLGRPGLLAALPGVAIAAALVPPIATTGICLALGELATTRGAFLLFSTNVLAIILGAGISFYAGGVRGQQGPGVQRWVRAVFVGLLLGMTLLAIPLSSELRSALGWRHTLPAELETQVSERVTREGGRLLAISRGQEDGRPLLRVEIAAPTPPSTALADDIRSLAQPHLGQEVRVRLTARLMIETGIEPSAED